MRTLFAILVVALVAFIIWRGWLQFNVSNNSEQTATTLTIDKVKIKQDLEAIKHEQPASAQGQNFAEITVNGRIQTLGPNHFTLRAEDGQTVNVTMMPETTVLIGDKVGTINDLRIGEAVTVAEVTRGDRQVATSVIVKR
jgi:hypothetical protein